MITPTEVHRALKSREFTQTFATLLNQFNIRITFASFLPPMATPIAPELIFGCAGFGLEIAGSQAVKEVLRTLKGLGVTHLDTVALYPPTNFGGSQRLLGELGAAQQGFTIDTKILIGLREYRGSLTPEKIAESIANSHEVLQLAHGQRINVLYAHTADLATPLKDQAYGFDVQHKKGMFDKVWASSFPISLATLIRL
jgi:aflatoxin B1 aldehyde reductase